ncbi:hypothetical protein [Pseudalkalibacillus berkeleyi]|uniref:Uncharacterized protein n=1 Tax=Pseudalkalibacillus berkeleyi TaxID=1069813 RepID=A0ABS9H229_9BACL|nr:hypothetical protein [Pseudalkalibacillus berkeleyi]MCF6137969.1 hypothetical protein [Pseudalkalibacillus berkeleyi]
MLEKLIELLMANLFFVILIIGGIYSFFKRQMEKYNEEQQPGKNRQRQHNPHQAETMSMPREERSRSSRPARQPSERSKKVQTNIEEMYMEKREEFDRSITDRSTTDRSDRMQRTIRPVRSKSKPKLKASKSDLIPNPDNVAQGVIWAEILGPPRSRKPHSTKMNQR